MSRYLRCILIGFILLTAVIGNGAVAEDAQRKDASSATIEANELVASELPFNDVEDFELARRGLIARPESMKVVDGSGKVVWDIEPFAFIEEDSPATVNPSLWRHETLNNQHGLYKVTDRIYQVRGFDVSNLSIIEGETGYIVVDPLITEEVAAAAMDLVYEELGKKPVVAVIYSHSHADHFGGVKGIVEDSEVAAGKVTIIASEGFMKFAVSENVLAGNVMTRRASYMFGSLLPKDEKGGVGVGIGKAISGGEVTLIEPTDIITTSGEEREIDGIRFVFLNTPFAEAPAELMFYLPEMKSFYAAEETNALMHNIYTLRGAEVRDGLLWSGYLEDAINLIDSDTEVLFGGHNWPRWGYDNIVEYLSKQRDLYKYIHDQTLRLANHGYTINEIPDVIELPDELGHVWFNRGYYGTLSHNSRAVYQKYLGFFDGNPATMSPLPPVEAGSKYVELAGGADELLRSARSAYENGEYRWVAELVNHLVFADPDNKAATGLQADALEQLGYQAESGQWRNFYLTAAFELRNGINPAFTTRTVSKDMIAALTLDNLFDYLAVRLNGPDAAGVRLSINFAFEDSGEDYVIKVENSVLRHASGQKDPNAAASVSLARGGLVAMTMAGVPIAELVDKGMITIDGDSSAVSKLVSLLDDFEFWFNIVTP